MENRHALRAHVVGHDLAGVDGLHGGVADSEDAAKDVDKRDARAARYFGAGLYVASRGAGGDGEADDHAGGGGEEHLASADAVVEEGAHGCEDPSCNRIHDIQEQLGASVCDADIFHEGGEVVGDDVVPRELAEPRECDV